MTEVISIDGPRADRDVAAGSRRAWAEPRRGLFVLFTEAESTLHAVRAARRFAPAFGGRITVVHFRPLDFAAPLDAPSGVSPAETEAFRERLAEEGDDVEVTVCVCRDARRALPSVIGAHSLVVVGGHHRWWPTGADRWRRRLEASGHLVVFVDEAANG